MSAKTALTLTFSQPPLQTSSFLLSCTCQAGPHLCLKVLVTPQPYPLYPSRQVSWPIPKPRGGESSASHLKAMGRETWEPIVPFATVTKCKIIYEVVRYTTNKLLKSAVGRILK